MNITPAWTTERVNALKALWNQGFSAAQIAKELGGITRNAVCGKINRLNGYKPAPKAINPAPAPKAKPKPAPAPVLDPIIMELPPDQSEFACTIDRLSDATCRWPLSDPAYDMPYCGDVPVRGHAYCPRHCAIAYRPVPPRRRG